MAKCHIPAGQIWWLHVLLLHLKCVVLADIERSISAPKVGMDVQFLL